MPDLEDLLSAASARVAVTPPGAETAVATARTRKRRRTTTAALALVALLGGAAAVVPQLVDDGSTDVVAPPPAAAAFGPLPPDEQVALLRDIRVTTGDQGVAAFATVAPGCIDRGRWDLVESPVEVQARFVLPVACVGASTSAGTATTRFAAPLGDRRLVVASGASDVVVRGDGALVFPPLAAGEEVAKLGFPAVLAGGASLTARYSAVTCTKQERWDVLESPTEIRARLVITGAPRPDLPSCVGQAPGVRDPVVTFTAPIAGRRLVLMSGVYELIVRDAVPAPTPVPTPAVLPATPPEFGPLGADEVVSRFLGGGVRTDPDGRALALAHSGCGSRGRLEAVEGSEEVRLRLVGTTSRGNQAAVLSCFSGVQRAPLVAPLGDRRVVLVTKDGEREVTPFDGRTLLEPTLPSGFLEQGYSQGYTSARGTTWSQSWRDPRLCAPGASSIGLTQGPGTDIAMRVTTWTVIGTRHVNGIPAELRRGNTGEYVLLWDTPQGRIGLTEGRVTTKGCSHFLEEDSLVALARTLHLP